ATAEAAQQAGFTVALIGVGGLQNVIDRVPSDTRLLRLAGAEHVALSAPSGVSIETHIVYEAVALNLPKDVRNLDEMGLRVLLHSAAAARQFDREAHRLALRRDQITLFAIGPRVASAAGKGWADIHVAESPNDRVMLELVRARCI
ncbi:MAG: uroporphyrinogen-III synthase, partial [Pseudomonadota bacterium]